MDNPKYRSPKEVMKATYDNHKIEVAMRAIDILGLNNNEALHLMAHMQLHLFSSLSSTLGPDEAHRVLIRLAEGTRGAYEGTLKETDES